MRQSLAVLASASLVNAMATKRDAPVVQTLNNWSSLGCYTDSQSARTLEVGKYFGEYNSDTDCQYKCQHDGWTYAGTTYSGQCFCGDGITAASKATKRPEEECYMACSGDSAQLCGGPDRINLFVSDTAGAPRPAASLVKSYGGYESVGCYTDSTDGRALLKKITVSGGAVKNSAKTCIDACKAAGYSLAGTEYANECYCGNDVNNNQALANDQDTCNMRCSGDSSTLCGGAGRLSLYSQGGATPKIAVPPTWPEAHDPTLPKSWAHLGCYSDSNGKRALGRYFPEPSTGLTVEWCVNKCIDNGYTLAGVEYGGECYCDNAVQNNQGLLSDSSVCKKPCNGDKGEICGGAGALNLYSATPGWKKLGCYLDDRSNKALTYRAPAFEDGMTNGKCLSWCQNQGYKFAGTEYANECYCGNKVYAPGRPADDGNAGCTAACTGNSTEICGGTERLSAWVYMVDPTTDIRN